MAKRRYSKEFRQFAVERLRGCENIVALARELHVSRRQLYRWRDELDPEIPGMETLGQDARASTLRKKVNHLKRVLAEKTLEVDFFKSALQKVEARRRNWAMLSYACLSTGLRPDCESTKLSQDL